jgi:hypothetical protein
MATTADKDVSHVAGLRVVDLHREKQIKEMIWRRLVSLVQAGEFAIFQRKKFERSIAAKYVIFYFKTRSVLMMGRKLQRIVDHEQS